MQPPYVDTGVPPSLLLLGIGVAYVLLAAWLKFIVMPRPLGTARMLAAVPVLIANVVCPWLFDSKEHVLQRLSTVFIYSWLCSFKVLALCWGRAPLRESMTVTQIAAVISLPLFPKPPDDAPSSLSSPKGRLNDSAGSGVGLASRWLGKIVLLGTVVFLVLRYGDAMPRALLYYTYSFGLYSFVGFLMDGPAALAVEALGLEVIPTFDQPWMSTCLADFWGRRWNIPTTSMLRTVVYDPIVDGSLILPSRLVGTDSGGMAKREREEVESSRASTLTAVSTSMKRTKAMEQQYVQPDTPLSQEKQQRRQRPSLLRRQLGLHATFFVSGLTHEYIAWLVQTNGSWGWKWTLFFYVQAPLMTLENMACRLLQKAGVRLPRWLTIPLTLIVLEAVAHELFFGFVKQDTDLAERVLNEVSANYSALLEPLKPVWKNLATWMSPL